MGFSDWFGSGEQVENNSGAFNDYANKMRDRSGAYQPWVDAGNQARGVLTDQYGRLVNDPNSVQDQVAGGFSMSPYQKYMQDMVQKRMNYNSANTGMMGSGAANRAMQEELTKMTGMYENDYINRGMDSYNKGLQGWGGMAEMGYKALGDQTDMLEAAYGGELTGDISQNQYDLYQDNQGNDMWGQILGVAGGAAGAYFGGPQGAMMGYQAGQQLGGAGQGQQQPQANQGNGMNLPNNWDFFKGNGGMPKFNPNNASQMGSGGYSPSSYGAGGYSNVGLT